MRTLARDTHPEAERVQLEVIRWLPPWRRLELIACLNRTLSGFALAGVKRRHRGAPPEEMLYALDQVRLGTDDARRLRDWRGRNGMQPGEDTYVSGDPVPTLVTIIKALDALDIPYYITGSLASGMYGPYRATNDADIVVNLSEEKVDALAALFPATYYADPEMMRDAIAHRSSFNIIDAESGFKVDLFVSQGRPFDRAQFARRVRLPLTASGTAAFVASPEGIILAKLQSTSEQQWNDVVGMLKTLGDQVDQAYLQEWGGILGVADIVARALDDAGLAPDTATG